MKILLLNKYHYRKGGAERAYFDMADILTAAGHEVAFFSMQHPKNETTPWSKYFVSESDYHAKQPWFQKMKTAFKIIWNSEANKKLEALINEFQPDIAHCHNIYHQLSPSIFHTLRKKGIPIVLTLHDYKLVSPNYNLYANGHIWDHSSGILCIKDRCIQGSLVKSTVCAVEKWVHSLFRSYHLVDTLIAPSQFLATKVKALGWNGKTIHVLPNPLRSEELEASVSTETRIKKRLVFFGRLSGEKGVDQLLRALALVPGYILVLIGEGPALEKLRLLSEELNIIERVQFIGARQGADLQRELRQAEAVVVPSAWYENLPYVITESLSLGLVVIAADSGGIQERITSGENGFLYPLGDVQALAETIKNLENQNLESIRSHAQKSIQDLSPEIFLRKIEELYQNLR